MSVSSASGVVMASVLAVAACGGSGQRPATGSAGGERSRAESVGVTAPEAPVVSCRERIEFPDFEGDPLERKRDLYAGSLRLGPVALPPGDKPHPNFGDAEHLRRGGGELVFPVDPIVPAGKTVTLAVAPADRDRVRLGLPRGGESKAPAVTLDACPASERRFSGEGAVGDLTVFREVFRVAERGCATLYVYADGRRFERKVSFGVERCPASSGN